MAYSYVYKPVENCRLLIKSVRTIVRVYQPLTDIAANIRKYQEAVTFTANCARLLEKRIVRLEKDRETLL